MSLKVNFELLATYNQNMNARLYAAAAQLSSTELAKQQGAFFGSVIHTLNHILVGDTIWLKRFSSHEKNLPSLNYVNALPMPASLDAMLYSDFYLLKEKREKMDAVIKLFVSELTDAAIAKPFSYVNTKGLPFRKNFGQVLMHFFNHQTHHRGQVSTLLYQQGVDVGVTDLLVDIANVE